MHNYCDICNARISYGSVRPLHEHLHLADLKIPPLCDNHAFYFIRGLAEYAAQNSMLLSIYDKHKALARG